MCCDNDTKKKKRIFDKFLLFFLIHIMCIYVYIYIYIYSYICQKIGYTFRCNKCKFIVDLC